MKKTTYELLEELRTMGVSDPVFWRVCVECYLAGAITEIQLSGALHGLMITGKNIAEIYTLIKTGGKS